MKKKIRPIYRFKQTSYSVRNLNILSFQLLTLPYVIIFATDQSPPPCKGLWRGLAFAETTGQGKLNGVARSIP